MRHSTLNQRRHCCNSCSLCFPLIALLTGTGSTFKPLYFCQIQNVYICCMYVFCSPNTCATQLPTFLPFSEQDSSIQCWKKLVQLHLKCFCVKCFILNSLHRIKSSQFIRGYSNNLFYHHSSTLYRSHLMYWYTNHSMKITILFSCKPLVLDDYCSIFTQSLVK